MNSFNIANEFSYRAYELFSVQLQQNLNKAIFIQFQSVVLLKFCCHGNKGRHIQYNLQGVVMVIKITLI